jgi:mRNA interferase RelE/StbE
MASYSLAYKPSVAKDLARLPRALLPRIWQSIEGLAFVRFPRGAVKLAGSQRLYRVRVGRYRIIYEVDGSSRSVTVHYVRHRRDAYRR